MRLIDADALKEQVCLDGDCTKCKTGVNESGKVCKWDMVQLNDAVERLESTPTIAEVQVVRCGDCLFCQMELYEGADELWCDIHGTMVDTETFCSWGIRRNNEINRR